MSGSTLPSSREDRRRTAIKGAWLGFYVDAFDIYLPVLALAPAMIYFTQGLTPTEAGLVAAFTFAATLIGRPLGALVLGHFSDTIGRQRIAVISAWGFGACTLAIGLLPGIEQIGIAAIVLLILLRGIDGFFLGGEYTAATPLAIEQSRKQDRGRVGGLIGSAFPAAYCTLAALVFVTLQIVPAGAINSPYVQWGWRVLFFIGAAMAIAFAIWYNRSVHESEVFEAAQQGDDVVKAPWRELFRGSSGRSFLQVFVMMTGVWLAANMLNAVMPTLLASQAGLSASQLTAVLVVANLITVGGYMMAGSLSQRWGRRTTLIGGGVSVASLAALSVGVIASGMVTGIVLLIVLSTICAVTVGIAFGIVPSYINERFQTGVRASAYGLGYSLSIVIPAFYAFYQLGLSTVMPSEYTPAALMVLGGALTALGAALGPETKDVDFPTDDQPAQVPSVGSQEA
ncbi:MFS transporter [Pseudonocardia sp. NPDC049635]|uniref:MFS transporter n=1 Tax=Pseudonocardia sp. NPDC049635 TaxID=3155506 RepID=UPI00340F8069